MYLGHLRPIRTGNNVSQQSENIVSTLFPIHSSGKGGGNMLGKVIVIAVVVVVVIAAAAVISKRKH